MSDIREARNVGELQPQINVSSGAREFWEAIPTTSRESLKSLMIHLVFEDETLKPKVMYSGNEFQGFGWAVFRMNLSSENRV